MPSINMIAGRRAEKRRQEQNLRKLIYGISVEAGCLILAISVLSVREVATRGRVIDLTAQIQNLQPKVNRIEGLQNEIALLQPKVKTLDGARADTLFWYSNIYNITASLPGKTWLTTLGVTGGGGAPGTAAGSDPTVSLSGMTLDQGMVGEAMLRMNQTPGLDHIDLSYVQQQRSNNVQMVSFQMTAHLKPEPSAATKEKATDVKKS